MSSFDVKNNEGRNFTLEHFKGNELVTKITADKIKYIEKDTTYRLMEYVKRDIGKNEDKIEKIKKKRYPFLFSCR